LFKKAYNKVHTYRAVRDVNEGFINFGSFILTSSFPPCFSFAAAKALAVGSITRTGFGGLGMQIWVIQLIAVVVYQDLISERTLGCGSSAHAGLQSAECQ
jgi:hypothetical protein